MSKLQPNQFRRGSEIATIPLTNTDEWLKAQIAANRHGVSKMSQEYVQALQGALDMKHSMKRCPTCNGIGYLS